MKKFLFLISHLGSGSLEFSSALDVHPRIQMSYTGQVYRSPLDLEIITDKSHKLDNSAAIYGDQLLFNHLFYSPALFKACKFVYLIRSAVPVMADLLINKRYSNLDTAFRYYSFRLRRICEMAKNTPGAVLLTYSDLIAGEESPVLEQYLGLKSPVVKTLVPPDMEISLQHEQKKKMEDCYERHLHFLKSLPLQRVIRG